MTTPDRRASRSSTRHPTIRDVAREAGVGVGTVSRVLNGSGPASAPTRQRVLEAVERLGFRPSRTARNLAAGRTQNIGVLVPFFTKHYFLGILRGIEQSVSGSDYSLVVYNVERPAQAQARLELLSQSRRVDGLIVVALSDSIIRQAYPDGFPFPIVGVDTEVAGATCIGVDHERGTYLAVRHLIELGHRQVAFIDRFQDPVSRTTSPARLEGYLKACQEADLAVPEAYFTMADYSQEGGHDAAARLLALSQPPTAIACSSDQQAVGAMRAVEERALWVGADVSITGYHDIDLAPYVGLTSVRVSAFDMGTAAARLLASILAGQAPPEEPIIFSPELVVRRTSGAPPASAAS